MKRYSSMLLVLLILAVSLPAWSADEPVEALLPQSCAPAWEMDGRPATYIPDSLYKYIDGEAELYLPYGFEKAATALYTRVMDRNNGLVVNIFKMGSHLDAFGIYGNYRSPGSEWVGIGEEGFVEETELFFYQNRYFVQIMSSGTVADGVPLLRACATAVSVGLPAGAHELPEIGLLHVPALVAHSEKYFPEGLLGYKFLGRGVTGEVLVKGTPAKALVVLKDSSAAAGQALEEYTKQLREGKGASAVRDDRKNLRVIGTDPLYKGVILQQSGRYVVGVVGLTDPHDGERVIDELMGRLPEEP